MLNFPFENPFSDSQIDDYSYQSMSNFPFENQLNENENENELLRKKKRNHSRYERDNILRKIKVDFHKFIINYLNSVYIKGKFKKKKFVRFAGYFQYDVTIRTNKALLNLPISEILTKVEAYKNLGDINKKLYDKIKNKQNEDNFSLTYEDFYKIYLRSEEVENLKKKEGDDIQKILDTFISFFKGKEPRSKNSKKSKLYTLLSQ